jgi:hypothetical protein
MTYCGTAAKAGGNGENKPHPEIMGVPYLLEKSYKSSSEEPNIQQPTRNVQ